MRGCGCLCLGNVSSTAPPLALLVLDHLFRDLQNRLAQLDADLSAQLSDLPSYAASYARKLQGQLSRSRAVIERSLADPQLTEPRLARYYYGIYRRLAELVDTAESGPVLVLSRFEAGERYLSALVQRICAEIAYPHTPPLCAAISTQYYWVMASMDLIFAPRTEVNNLLALPDVYHELGHILVDRDGNRLLQPLRVVIDDYFDRHVMLARQRGWDVRSIAEIEQQRRAWQREWVVEVCCDLIATYCCGLSYGLANTRLSAMSANPYLASDSHPPDDARARAIEFFLRAMGLSSEATASNDRWQSVLSLGSSTPSFTYQWSFANELLQALATELLRCIQSVGLVAFGRSTGVDPTVAAWIAEAWQQFLERPHEYGEWQRARVRVIRQILSATDP
jgi:hypothetical protein